MDHDISDFDTFPLEELWLRRESPIAATEDTTQSTRDLADSATPLPRMSRELKGIRVLPSGSTGTDDFVAPRTSVLKSSTTLRFLSLILHWTLVGIHSALIFMWVKGPKHRLVVLMHQGIASLLLTISSTAFTTADPVDETGSPDPPAFDTTHDNAAAWSGLGSAVLHIWHQRTVVASREGVLLAALYLGNIAILHITMPNVLLLQSVPAYRSVLVETQVFWGGGFFVEGSLGLVPLMLGNASREGLRDGTLYEVLGANAGTGNATVNATGFNITCHSLPEAHRIPLKLYQGLEDRTVALDSAEMMIFVVPQTVQIFRCSQSLVLQTAVIDVKSREYSQNLLNLVPSVLFEPGQPGTQAEMLSSTWFVIESIYTSGNSRCGSGGLVSTIPSSEFPRFIARYTWRKFLSFADLTGNSKRYLIQKFNLAPAEDSKKPSNVALHDLENELSTIVAAMFWTLGHVFPSYGRPFTGKGQQLLTGPPEPPFLLKGNAMVNELLEETRLDVVVGLTASTIIALVSLRYSLFHDIPRGDKDLAIGGSGILHTIWLYRNHPELDRFLDQAERPTDENLRKAGW
ncbi:hypothetical protein B0H13DRAFT_1934641 [Mycena leptocephala]|nr:hypothetical protein B0H13DRAFT_1934641 [Mycena leptocephala]